MGSVEEKMQATYHLEWVFWGYRKGFMEWKTEAAI